MTMIDIYRNNMIRKCEEIVKLTCDRSNENGKISFLNTKILSAEKAIFQTKSSSTVQSKLR